MLAFTALVDGRSVIHVMQLDSREPIPVTTMMYDARSPQWSPEGTRLAFIAAINANEPSRLCMAVLPDYQMDCLELSGVISFAWAPSGDQLVIATNALVDGPSYKTYLYDLKNRKLSVLLEADVPTVHLEWSPDGRWISAIATSVQTTVRFVYLLSTHGQMQRLQLKGMPETLDWHPSGQQLAYDNIDYPTFDQLDIHVINVDGTGDHPLTNMRQFAHEPQWSPSGTSLAFQSYGPNESPALYIMDVKAGRTTQISPLGARSSVPTWSPDGRIIAFLVETEDVQASGYSLNLYYVGTGIVQELLGGGLLPRWPAWRP
jgi:TolB protein